MSSASSHVNIAAYKFVTFDNTEEMRPQYQALCQELGLKGTILLTPEGINLFLSGPREKIDHFLAWLRGDERFADIDVKESYSEEQSHKRMLVKIKKEIITMRMPLIQPELGRAPAVSPRTLKRWLDQGHDDSGKPVVMVDLDDWNAMRETAYLLSTPNNARNLMESIAELDAGNGTLRELINP